MAIDPRLKRKIRSIVCIKDRTVRQLVKSVFLHEAGYINTIEADGPQDALEKLGKNLSMKLPVLVLMDNQETWKKTFAFIDKIRTNEATRDAEFILLADADNDPIIESEVQQRQLGKLLPKPFSRVDFQKAFDTITANLAIPVQTANILVVDDDRSFSTMLAQDYFAPAGFGLVTTSNSYDDALRHLNAVFGRPDQIDLIISDMKMPVHTGLDLLKRIRSDQRWETTPFLMLSGTADKAAVMDCLKNKVSEFVVKPISNTALIEKVTKYLPWFTKPKA